jgi:hypothetical protein
VQLNKPLLPTIEQNAGPVHTLLHPISIVKMAQSTEIFVKPTSGSIHSLGIKIALTMSMKKLAAGGKNSNIILPAYQHVVLSVIKPSLS